MKKQLGIILLCSFGIMTACAPGGQTGGNMVQTEVSKESSETVTQAGETEAEESETEAETEAADEAFETFKDLSLVLGASDESIKDSYGGGRKNMSADGTLLIGREYQTSLKGEAISMVTMYDDEENVMMVQVMLPGKDSLKYQDELSKELALEPESDGSGEGGSSSMNWNCDGILYTLHRNSGENILEIIALQS